MANAEPHRGKETTANPARADRQGHQGHARKVPVVEEIRPLVARRVLPAGLDPDARLFTGPRGGRVSTAVLRDAGHGSLTTTQRYLHPGVHKITAAGAALPYTSACCAHHAHRRARSS
ncbi:hypothetical protein [Streptomyces sp. Ag109_O5-10]|uniref:hypothetical protein n=1 Tax=Streptomyces sp. Ag109_O5-10 TaxID=1855349 RepID=UPI000B1EF7CC|nr:hypothetical protein [Streptomyces sp. Ag109_O5-10]